MNAIVISGQIYYSQYVYFVSEDVEKEGYFWFSFGWMFLFKEGEMEGTREKKTNGIVVPFME